MTSPEPGRGPAPSPAATDQFSRPLAAGTARSSLLRDRKVVVWALWDWASAAFNAVITTFVFSVYLTNSDLFGPGADRTLAVVLAVAGVAVALTAPVTGQRADRSGRRAISLAIYTGVIALVTALMFFVQPAVQEDGSFAAQWLWLGLILLAVGNVASELAGVNYNAMLNGISTPANVGRVSGFGWGLGYVGGIVLLLIVYFGLINPEIGLFGVTSERGMDVRVTTLVAALWTAVFSLPLIVSSLRAAAAEKAGRGPEQAAPKESVLESYRRLLRSIVELARSDRRTAFFLLASAVFRDGLAGVFTFGGIIASGTFGFSAGDVIIFAVAANVVAGIATIAFGRLDDALGPKTVIVLSLTCMVIAGIGVFILHDLGAVRVAHVPRPAHPGRQGGRGLRPLRHDRPRGLLPRAGHVRRGAVDRRAGHRPHRRRRPVLGNPRHRPRARLRPRSRPPRQREEPPPRRRRGRARCGRGTRSGRIPDDEELIRDP
jgi:UMF1 family MFS transporter